jgi:hypothetical protein
LREANFRRLIGAQSASLVGDYMILAAMPFAVFAVSGSTTQVGIAFGVDAAALLALVLVGGVFGDRVSRRSVMIGADMVRFGAEATSGLLPETVGPERLQEANALRGLCASCAAMVGPALAGVLLATLGPGWVFVVDAASFLLSATFLAKLRLSAGTSGEGSIVVDLVEGWNEFRRRTWLWAVVAEFALLNALVFAPFYVFGASVAEHSLGGPGAWAAILAAFGVGELVGGILALSWRPRKPLLVATAIVASWVPPLLLLAVLAPIGAIVPFAAAAGMGLALFATLWHTTLQNQVPSEQLARLSSYDWMGSVALLPVGYLLAGFIGAALGPQGALLGAGVATLVATLVVVSVPSVRSLGSELEAPA